MTQDNGGSERLRDRAQSEFQQRRMQAQEGATRLRDRADSVFQQRRKQAQRARDAIEDGTEEFGAALGIDADNVEPVQLDDRGESFGFVPDETGRDELATDFAAERPFVEPGDALVDADPREGVQTRTDPGAKDRVADRARQETAADADFIEAADLDAEVGPGGVSGLEIAEDRRDVVADRTREQVAAEDEFAEPGDFDADVGPRGIESVGLSDSGARRRAGRQFEAETPLTDVDAEHDVRADGDSFRLDTGAQRRIAAREFESELDTFARGELDPEDDVRDTNGGFGLAEGPTREVAAAELDDRVSDRDITPGDIELEDTGDGGFEAIFDGGR